MLVAASEQNVWQHAGGKNEKLKRPDQQQTLVSSQLPNILCNAIFGQPRRGHVLS